MIQESKYHQTAENIALEQKQIVLAQQNPAAFEVLYNKYYEPIVKFIYLRVNSKDDAFDLAQQVFLIALQNIKKYQIKGLPFSSWLYRIAINEMNGMFRKNAKARAINIEDDVMSALVAEVDSNNNEENQLKLENALLALSEEDLQILELRFFEKRAFAEIGEILGITENNAKVKTYRAVDKLKPFFKK